LLDVDVFQPPISKMRRPAATAASATGCPSGGSASTCQVVGSISLAPASAASDAFRPPTT
jgi:hypothetical protein